MPSHLLLPIALGALAALIAGMVGFFVGRSRPRAADLARITELDAALKQKQSELEASVGQLDSARAEAEATRTGIDAHFDRSAALFGRLAQDYRALFDHWTESAGRLGVSDAQAEALIEGVRTQLLADAASAEDDAAESASPDAAVPVNDADLAPEAKGDADADTNMDAEAAIEGVTAADTGRATEVLEHATKTETESESESDRKSD